MAGAKPLRLVFELVAPFIWGAWGVMFHLDGEVGFNAGQGRQDVIQDLLGGHPKSSAARAVL